jgi:hypothetical protein
LQYALIQLIKDFRYDRYITTQAMHLRDSSPFGVLTILM